MSFLLATKIRSHHFKVTSQSSRYEGVLRIIQRIFFLFLDENISCDPLLEPSQQDGSTEGHNICFKKTTMEYYS